MARTGIEFNASGEQGQSHEGATVLSASDGKVLNLPAGDFVSNAEIIQDGQDLVLRAPDGSEVVIEGYFSADPQPVLLSPNGTALTPALVESFAKTEGPLQVASQTTANDASPVGVVEESSGGVTVTRTDGTVETVQIGMPIYQGDILETDAEGAVSVTFVDESNFAISEDAKLAIDEYVFDPSEATGNSDFSVLRGVFVFTSGVIGRDDPDQVDIETPVGSIGIRGTVIAGKISESGEGSQITVVEGAIVVRNAFGESTLSGQFETVQLNGFNSEIVNVGILDASQVNETFSSVRSVAPTLFSAVDDAGRDAATQQQQRNENGPDSREGEGGDPVDAAPNGQPGEGDAEGGDRPQGEAGPADGQSDGEPGQPQGEPAPDQTTGEAAPAPAEPQPGTVTAQAPAPGPAPVPAPAPTGEFRVSGTKPPAPVNTTQTVQQPVGEPIVTNTGGTTQTGTTTPQTGTSTNTGTGDSGAATAPPPILPLELQAEFIRAVPEDFTPPFDVALIRTTSVFPSVQFTFQDASGKFEALSLGDGRLVVRVKSSAVIDFDTQAEYPFQITAKLSDGRSVTRGFFVQVHDSDSGNTAGGNVGSGDVLDLGNLPDHDGHSPAGEGFFLPGVSMGSGHSVAALGDIDNDGHPDIAYSNDAAVGEVQVLDSLTAPPVPYGLDGIGLEGHSVIAAIGDFDRDGHDDFLVGTSEALTLSSGNATGNAYIVSGADPTQQIKMDASSALSDGDEFGHSVAGIGDFNGDGITDLVIGAPNNGGSSEGAIFILYGDDGTAIADGTQDLDSLSTSDGIYLTGAAANNAFGESVAGLADFNGDGHGDIAIVADNAQTVYVLLGDNSNISSSVPITDGSLSSRTFTVTGLTHTADISVDSLGDINGDGKTDFVISDGDGATGKAYVVFGTGSAGGSAINVANLDGTNGFKIPVPAAGTELFSGGAAGDFNGDGYDDGVLVYKTGDALDIFVVYGKESGWAENLATTDLNNAAKAFKMHYEPSGGIPTNFDVSVAPAGDFNGDGFGDIIFGMPNDGANGQTFVVYGRDENSVVKSSSVATINADHAGQALVGGVGANTFNDSNLANVHMSGGGGNDTFNLQAMDAGTYDALVRGIDGGAGLDTIKLQTNDMVLDLTHATAHTFNAIEKVELLGTGQSLKLAVSDIHRLLQQSADDTLKLWVGAGGQVETSGFVIENDGTGSSTGATAQDKIQNLLGASSYTDQTDHFDFAVGGYTIQIHDDLLAQLTIT